MKRIIFYVAGLALMGLLAACGSSITGGNTTNGSDLTATSADVQATASAALDDLNTTGAMLDSGVTQASLQAGASAQSVNSLEAAAVSWKLPPRVYALLRDLGIWIPVKGSPAAAGCNIVVAAAITAPQYKVTFDCSGKNASDSRSYSTKGEVDLTLQNGKDEAAGYTANFIGFDTLVTFADKSNFERKLVGSLSVDKTAWLVHPTKPWNITKNYTHSVTKNNTAGTAVYSGQNVFQVSKTYQPDTQATPGLAGLITIAQSAPGTDNFTNLLNQKTRSLSFFTNPTVHWNSACTVRPRFDAGEKDYSFTNANNVTSTLVIKFTACGSYTITFNGGAVSAPTSN